MSVFVVLEGLDGAGTTTQRERIAEALERRGFTVVKTFEPTDGPIGREIRRALRKEPGAADVTTLPWMFVADRADHLARLVEPSLADGKVVLSDRYLPSSVAYQSVEHPAETVLTLNQFFRVPDITLWVDVPVSVALERIQKRALASDHYEDPERLRRVANGYAVAMQELSARGWPIAKINGDQPIDAVTAACLAAIEEVMP